MKNSYKIINTGINSPDIAIAMLAYNHENYIGQAIESVLMQKTSYNYKIIIAEDYSTDNTRKIVLEYQKKYPDKVKLILQDKNVGANLNNINLLSNLEGKYVAALEGDDYWTDPLKLQKQVDFLEANLDYVLCFHRVNILKINGEIVDDFITKVPENHEAIETLARLGNYIHTPSVVFRNVLKEFPFEFEHSPIGDYFLYMMLAEQGKLKYLDEKMGVYRYGVGGFSGNSRLTMAKTNLKLFTCLLSYLKDDEIKKIIFDRQIYAVAHLEKILHEEYDSYFVSNHIFFRAVKSTQTYLTKPSKILKKIILKFKK
ncbi:glycosyltransferase family 2 protein [Flavobacterium sp. GT2N3]|uniref:glycosyltransferase family 2 protein n=1 Tax=unclassified Flavobacterium TaxID=196869 RepID=UPI003AAE5C42